MPKEAEKRKGFNYQNLFFPFLAVVGVFVQLKFFRLSAHQQLHHFFEFPLILFAVLCASLRTLRLNLFISKLF